MGKACLILAGMMLTLALYPKGQVNAASLENPMMKDKIGDGLDLDKLDRNMMGLNGDREDEYNDYDFLNHPRFGSGIGGYPRGVRAMQRHERLMKRLRRQAMEDQPSFLE